MKTGRNAINEIGKRYGKLLVVKRDEKSPPQHAYWTCKCDCGTERVVLGNSLRNGRITNCGVKCRLKFDVFVGRRFGKYTVIGMDKPQLWISPSGRERYLERWICRCDCGNTRSVRPCTLKNGGAVSCGCSWILPNGEASFNDAYEKAKNIAFRRKREWSLSKEEYRKVSSKPCFYCGAEPSQARGKGKLNGIFLHNGLDRVDSSKDYFFDNVVSCCWKCNRAKNNMSIHDFKVLITSIHNHWASK